ncbi:MAG: hypothetical protein ACJAYU_003423 [Bradymonadia bacterium]|jgi:hypothetical protein
MQALTTDGVSYKTAVEESQVPFDSWICPMSAAP